MEKKGMGHIEVILAFVLFAGFLIFALFFFNPLNVNRVADSSLGYAIDEISSNISVKLETYSVVLGGSVPGGVVSFPIENPNGLGLRVEDSAGNKLDSQYSGGKIIVDHGSERYLNVMFSEDFVNGAVSGTPIDLNNGDYVISSSDEREVWSEKKALELNQSYYENYAQVHEEFNLPNRVDFGFVFEILDGEGFRADINRPDGLEVWSDGERKETISSDGGLRFADLTVTVW